ncbi:MAG: ribosome recycling factor [Bdellovibrionales bacterium RIFOXYB1_FULL_37_110]|nr:MAG: ribosome recycling factor [Bdellovibrionales bacterium RIFOXYC1_FULL_37_79]OFZ59865.1 MAG: ribosome recycling factor [Bdellovibrionales bacterium RIFOXYB1_FULL_37_110]OFZ65479.1 MAG: ribosome recycling factor [Bdellovibrionales bacterium RIFOXYD1_FULL_36_51]
MWNKMKNNVNVSMEKAIDSLKHQLSKIRTGRATDSVLDGITVDYYGMSSPIKQVGQVSIPEARLLQIQPYDKTMIPAIEKSILAANIGVTPSNDGNLIRVPFPALTEEKRKQQVKEVKKVGEETKVAVRNIRRDQNELVKKAEKDKTISEDESKKIQKEIQDVTDKYIKNVDDVIKLKEQEIMTI